MDQPQSSSPILVVASDAAVRKWIGEELAGERFEVCESVAAVAKLVNAEPSPGPDVVIVDFDELQAYDIEDLRSMRGDWSGTLIALGRVPLDARRRIGGLQVVERPLGSESLRKVVTEAARELPTTRIPKLDF